MQQGNGISTSSVFGKTAHDGLGLALQPRIVLKQAISVA